VLRRLPFECLEMAFKRMRCVDVTEGQDVIRPGDDVKSCYVLTEGRAEVWHADVYTDELQLIEVMTEGASFGNDSLLTGYKSRELVRMKSDGKMLVLDKQDFDALVRKQLVRTVNARIAKTMIENGYRLLDVRYEEEHDESRIPNSTLIPLGELHHRAGELDPEERYIAYCHSGNRSAVAAMKLAQLNVEALSLEGGIRDWPFEIEGSAI
jgi:rhodanese-related sulfurtransferase